MGLRPRTEYLDDDLPMRWWEWRQHPGGSAICLALALLNLAFLVTAFIGFLRRRVPLAGMLAGYVLLRSLLLLTMENAEQRYTIVVYPVILIAASLALAGRGRMAAEATATETQ